MPATLAKQVHFVCFEGQLNYSYPPSNSFCGLKYFLWCFVQSLLSMKRTLGLLHTSLLSRSECLPTRSSNIYLVSRANPLLSLEPSISFERTFWLKTNLNCHAKVQRTLAFGWNDKIPVSKMYLFIYDVKI